MFEVPAFESVKNVNVKGKYAVITKRCIHGLEKLKTSVRDLTTVAWGKTWKPLGQSVRDRLLEVTMGNTCWAPDRIGATLVLQGIIKLDSCCENTTDRQP